MNLSLLRHASAGTRRDNPLLDAKRSIDKEGKQQCMLVGGYLSALDVQFDLIVSSPLKRALQTASLVGNETGYDARIMISEALAPGGTPAALEKLVASLAHYDEVLLVGHNPGLSVYLNSIIGARGAAARLGIATPETRGGIRLRKGAVARVDCSRRPAMLQWLVDPRSLRALRTLYSKTGKSSRRKTSRK